MEKNDIIDELPFYSDDTYKTFINLIRSYPRATTTSNHDNYLKYRETGKKEYFDLLVMTNIRYVVTLAMPYVKQLNHLEIMDIIDNGIVGLIKGIDTYNPDKGAFSTHVTFWIKREILIKIYETESIVRKPIYMSQLLQKYKNLLVPGREYTDDEICDLLRISPRTLALVRDTYEIKTRSLDEKISDDSKTDLGYFIADKKNDYNELIDEYDNNNLKIVLKHRLNNIQYFTIYYRYLSENKKTLEEIASYFSVSRERIRQIEVRALEIARPFLNHNNCIYRDTLSYIQDKEGTNFKFLSVEPLSPSKIIVYLYLRDKLTKDERLIYEELLFGNYQPKATILAIALKKSLSEINKLVYSINTKRKKYVADFKFQEFKKNTILKYGTCILNFDKISQSDVDYNQLLIKYADLSLEEIYALFNQVDYSLNADERRLLESYFSRPIKHVSYSVEVEKEINLMLFGYQKKRRYVSRNKLYEEYLRIKEELTLRQQYYLECFFFEKRGKKEFDVMFPNQKEEHEYQRAIMRLERSYYNIYDFFDRTFTKEMWETVREKYQDYFTPLRLKIMDMEYGLDGKTYKREEMAHLLGVDKEWLAAEVRGIINYANSLYMGMGSRMEFNKSLYIPYIKDKGYSLSSLTRNILELAIIQNKSYDEISEITRLDKDRISNIITKSVRRMDSYRFGINDVTRISKDELYRIFTSDLNIDETRKKILELKYLEYLDNSLIAEKMNIPLKNVNMVIWRFNNYYYLKRIKDVPLNDEDLIAQVSLHVSETILKEKERRVISLLFGLKNDYNPLGKKLSRNEIIQELNISSNDYYNTMERIKNNVKGYKIGLKRADDCYIKRDKLNEVLDDIHLPISDKDRDIICYLFELKGFPYKTMNELEEVYGDKVGSIKIRYQRAIVNIYKYLNGEIDGKLSYEADIIPLLKFFSIFDRNRIKDFYCDGLTYDEMCQKYHEGMGAISSTMQRINTSIYELMHNSRAKKFDFDYYQEAIKNPDLPFYGNLDVATQLFDLTFGMNGEERMSVAEAVKRIGLNIDNRTAHRTIACLMLAVCKLRDGIQKEKHFAVSEVIEYYERNKDMPEWRRVFYEHYLNRAKNHKMINETTLNMSYVILNDLIKDKFPNAFVVDKASREDVIKILRKYRNSIMRRVKMELMGRFDIREREFMNGKDMNHLCKLLSKLDTMLKNSENRLVLRRDID